MSSELDQKPLPCDSKDYYTVMVHFYRGELGRIMIWRQRLDVTTNWAILSMTGLITYGLGDPKNTQLIFLFANVVCFLLLVIEARRYRYYDAFRARVRMLEAHFLMPVVMRDAGLLQGEWRKLMAEDLLMPTFKISRWTALVRRFKRNYLWIFCIIASAWVAKIWLHFENSHTPMGFINAIQHHSLPAWFFWILFAIVYGTILTCTVASFTLDQNSGEFSIKAMHRKKWTL